MISVGIFQSSYILFMSFGVIITSKLVFGYDKFSTLLWYDSNTSFDHELCLPVNVLQLEDILNLI